MPSLGREVVIRRQLNADDLCHGRRSHIVKRALATEPAVHSLAVKGSRLLG